MKRKGESQTRRIAFPTAREKQIVWVCRQTHCSFSAFANEAVMRALEEKRKGRVS